MAQGLLNFVVVGAKNSGKTVFLSTLFGMEQSIATANKETTEYLKANWNEISNGDLPSATSSRIITLEFEYKTDTYSVGFYIDDYDGYFVETLSTDEEQTQEDRDKLRKNIKEAEGLLFFFPFEKTFDEKALERFRYEINTFIQLIKDIYPDQKDLPIPAVIAVSKWDRSPDFGGENQHQKAAEYLDSVESYRTAIAMIKSFFADVIVEPVSSFGNSDDGVHPVKGRIEPYNLRGPFDYFLDITFHKFEKRATDLQTDKNLQTLYAFLTAIYNDVRFYKEGKLIKLHSEVEAEYASEVIHQLKTASGPSEQRNILDEHSFLYDNIRTKELADQIEAVVTEKKIMRNKSLGIIVGAVILLILIVGYGFLAYNAYEKEHNAFATINQLKPQSVPKEFYQRCMEYLEEYSGKSFLLPITDVAAHRDYVEGALSSAKATFVATMTQTYNRLKDQEPNDRNLVELRDLQANAALFPYLEISQRVTDFSEQFLMRMENRNTTARIVNEAKTLFASDADLSEVENILTQLNDLPDDKEISELKTNLSQRLQILQLQREFSNLYNEIKDEKRFREIPKIVGKQWRKEFPEEFRQRLTSLIQDKIAERDAEAINDLRSRFESAREVDVQEKNLTEINNHFIEIPQLSFRYQRNNDLKNKLKRATNSTKQYRQLLNHGIWVEAIVFGAFIKDNKPLKFACGFFKGNEIILEIGNDKFSYKSDPEPTCTGYGEGRQQLRWEVRFQLQPRAYSINVKEEDPIYDEDIDVTVSISKKDILDIYNNGEKEFPFPN